MYLALCNACKGTCTLTLRRPNSTDGLNLTQWIDLHRTAITGLFPCCGCWAAHTNGSFYSTGDI